MSCTHRQRFRTPVCNQAEVMYRQALSVDNTHPRTVENYARFLMDVRGQTSASIELLKR